MKAFVIALAVAVGMGVVAYTVLESNQISTAAKYTTSSVRN
jgi:hypothetical protein